MPGRFGRSLLSLGLASVVAGVSSAAISAGAPVIFTLSPFDECIAVEGPADTPIDIEVRAANGELRGADRPTLDSAGMGTACFAEKPLPFDTIHATWAPSLSRTFTVPRLTARVDRVADIVKGRAPANSTVEVELTTNHAVSPPLAITKSAATSPTGRYSADFTTVRNLRGGDSLMVTWTSGSGDIVHEFVTSPYLTVWVKSALFESTVNVFQASTFSLRTPGGGLRTQLTRYGDEDGQIEQSYWTTTAGGYLPTAIGDRVSATFASDASMVIPDLRFSIDSAADTVSGSCLGNRRYWIDINGPGGGTSRIGNASPTGAFSEDFTTGSIYDIVSGDVVTVHCMFGTGDQVARRGRAH